MGQIKNIKLHIVTDIKEKETQKVEQLELYVIASRIFVVNTPAP